MKPKFLIKLSIPLSASKKGQAFLQFCVKHFGGKSKFAEVEKLDNETLNTLADDFAKLSAKLFDKGYLSSGNSKYNLRESDLGDAFKDGNVSLYLEILPRKPITKEQDDKYAMFFLKKVRQLFDCANYLQQWGRREDARWKDYCERKAQQYQQLARPPKSGYGYLFDD